MQQVIILRVKKIAKCQPKLFGYFRDIFFCNFPSLYPLCYRVIGNPDRLCKCALSDSLGFDSRFYFVSNMVHAGIFCEIYTKLNQLKVDFFINLRFNMFHYEN